MKRLMTFAVLNLALVTACSTHMANLSYAEFKNDMPNMKSTEYAGESLGAVKGEEGGAIWNNCTEKAHGSVRELIENTKRMGGNAIGNIKWAATNSDQPSCKKGWGYLLVWPFILTPLFMSTEVRGTAYKVSGKASANLIMLPTTAAEEKAFYDHVLATTK